jgi:hypothetical protein
MTFYVEVPQVDHQRSWYKVVHGHKWYAEARVPLTRVKIAVANIGHFAVSVRRRAAAHIVRDARVARVHIIRERLDMNLQLVCQLTLFASSTDEVRAIWLWLDGDSLAPVGCRKQ